MINKKFSPFEKHGAAWLQSRHHMCLAASVERSSTRKIPQPPIKNWH
jgi:hypothetical protein